MIVLHLLGIPPSTNHAYAVVRGRKLLTAQGKKYKLETTAHLARAYPGELKLFQPNKPFGVAYIISTPTLENAGWGKSATTRYKRFDGTNRLKLVEDALVDATGVDDSNFLTTAVRKAFHPTETTTIICWDIEKEGGMPDGVIQRLR